MSKSILHILTFIIFTVFLASCVSLQGSSRSNKVVKHVDTFGNKIDKYEASRSETYYYIEETTQRTIISLGSKTLDFGNISEYWEREWKVVHSHYDQLEKDFTKVVKESNAYFKIIDNVANDIIDPKMKQAELNINEDLKINWITSKDAADTHIKSLSQVIQTGDDFHKTMLGATLRARPEGSIDTIERISEESRLLLKDLINLTIEGRNLISGGHVTP
tara:strand:- start:260 stop:916 length:657 start_codon:yes stop_codon:yes gene_type:complete